MAEEREFGVATNFDFPLVVFGSTDADFSTGVTFDVSAGDIRFSLDGSTFNPIDTTTPSAIGINSGIYTLALTSTETTGARGMILIVDQTASKVWEDQAIIFNTYGSTLGQHAFNRNSTGVNVNSIDVGAITSTAFAASAINSTAIATGAITAEKFTTGAIDAAALATDAAQEIRDEIMPTQNAAFNNIEFLFVGSTDHVTPVTGTTGVGSRSIDGSTFVAVEGTVAEVSQGIYQFDATSSDMNGGIITFRFTGGIGDNSCAPDDRFVTLVTGGGV